MFELIGVNFKNILRISGIKLLQFLQTKVSRKVRVSLKVILIISGLNYCRFVIKSLIRILNARNPQDFKLILIKLEIYRLTTYI